MQAGLMEKQAARVLVAGRGQPLAAGSGLSAAGAMRLRSWDASPSPTPPAKARASPLLSARRARVVHPAPASGAEREVAVAAAGLGPKFGWQDAPDVTQEPITMVGASELEGAPPPHQLAAAMPSDRERFFGRLSAAQVQAELERQSTLLRGLVRDMDMVKNALWHIEDDKGPVEARLERLEGLSDAALVAEKLGGFEGRVALMEARLAQAEESRERELVPLADRVALLDARALVLEARPVVEPGAVNVALSGLEAQVDAVRADLALCGRRTSALDAQVSFARDSIGARVNALEACLGAAPAGAPAAPEARAGGPPAEAPAAPGARAAARASVSKAVASALGKASVRDSWAAAEARGSAASVVGGVLRRSLERLGALGAEVTAGEGPAPPYQLQGARASEDRPRASPTATAKSRRSLVRCSADRRGFS
ncbi:unnamed protein product [Prorocentrum cordatum]|uniref:Uncharacterized protein n=1 Tax=Prorocentrum cordatum TaxID=2364126 RepID=A0ABN9QZF5_9DINO|nr:unnamed protein product [Polarella glacialis]